MTCIPTPVLVLLMVAAIAAAVYIIVGILLRRIRSGAEARARVGIDDGQVLMLRRAIYYGSESSGIHYVQSDVMSCHPQQ